MQQVSNLRIFEVINKNVDKEAAFDIAAVLSQSNRINLKSKDAIEISKALQNTVNLNQFILSNDKEAVDGYSNCFISQCKVTSSWIEW